MMELGFWCGVELLAVAAILGFFGLMQVAMGRYLEQR